MEKKKIKEKGIFLKTMEITLNISLIVLAIVFLYNTYGRSHFDIYIQTDCNNNIEKITGYNLTENQTMQIQNIIWKETENARPKLEINNTIGSTPQY